MANGMSHGVEAFKPVFDLRSVFRLWVAAPVLSGVEGLNTNGPRVFFNSLLSLKALGRRVALFEG